MNKAQSSTLRRLLLGVGALVLSTHSGICAATLTWSASPSSSTWSTGANWTPTTPPGADGTGDALVFGASGTTTLNNDISGLSLASLTFSSGASAYTLGGNAVTMTGTTPVTNSSSNTQTINFAMALSTSTVANFVTTATGGNIILNGVVSGAGKVSVSGGGTITLGNAANTYTGATDVVGDSTISITTFGTGGTASSLGKSATVDFGNSQGGGTIIYTGSGESTTKLLSYNGQGNGAASKNYLAIQNDGTGALNFTSSTGLTFTGANGTSRTLELQGSYVGSPGAYNTFAPTIADGAVPVSFQKNGAGTWAITGANTYTGGTTVSAGVLFVNNTSGSSGTGTGGISVTGGTLGGTGFIAPTSVTSGNAVTIASGAYLSPSAGNGGASTLTFALSGSSTLNLNSGAKLVFDLGTPNVIGGGVNDWVDLTAGTLTLNSQTITDFTFNQEAGFNTGTYTLISTSAANDLTGTFSSSSYTQNGLLYTLFEDSSKQDLLLDVSAEVVPEPETWAMMVGGLALLVLIQRRRRAADATPSKRA